MIETPGRRKSTRLCHVNLLKPYHTSESVSPLPKSSPAKPVLVSGPVLTSSMSELVLVEEEGLDIAPDDGLLRGRLKNSETLQDLNILVGYLYVVKREELTKLINSYLSLFSDTQTHLIEHDLDIGVAEPIKQRFYSVR